MNDRPPDMRPPDRGSELAVIMWIAGFLVTLTLFVAFCWWKAHYGGA